MRTLGDRVIPAGPAAPVLAIGDVFAHASAPLDAREVLACTVLDDLVQLSPGPVLGGLRPSRQIHKAVLLSPRAGWRRLEIVRLAPRAPAAERVRPLAARKGQGSNGVPHG